MRIKYCIWDVGNVVYGYSLDPLHRWVAERTEKPEMFAERKGKFSFNDYMTGRISFAEMCRNLGSFYGVPEEQGNAAAINRALFRGVGSYYQETRQAMAALKSKGIQNCLLSNALPVLSDTAGVDEFVPKERQFASYDLGLLKPDPAIYEAVRRRLGCTFAEMMFVDDKPKNVQAAVRLDIYGIVFNPQTILAEVSRVAREERPIINSRGGR